MTALNIFFEPNQVCIATDTLACDGGLPRLYASKIFPLSHLNGVLCGTGAFGLLMDWFVAIQSGAIVRDIIELDQFTPEQLQRLGEKYGLDEQHTTTIYHFGYSETEERFRGFVYRSTNAFASEELEYQIRLKPAVDIGEVTSLPADFIKAMKLQRQMDKQQPVSSQVGIGGEIHFAVLRPGSINITNCHRFEDYETDFTAMLENTSRG